MSNFLESASQSTADDPGEDNPAGGPTAGVPPLHDRGITMVPICQPTAYPGNAPRHTQVCGVDHQHAKTGKSD
jgi:hypothetical protein